MARIDKVDFGEIVIGGKSYYSDVSIDARGVVEHRPKTHRVRAGDIVPLLKGKPQCIVIGNGMEGAAEIGMEIEQMLEEQGIELFVEKTPKAAHIFNGLLADKKKVAGLFHLTS